MRAPSQGMGVSRDPRTSRYRGSMRARIGDRLTYANVTATLALFIVLGGGAYAASQLPANSVGSKQLKRHAVTPSKVAAKTVALFRGKNGATHVTARTDSSGIPMT